MSLCDNLVYVFTGLNAVLILFLIIKIAAYILNAEKSTQNS